MMRAITGVILIAFLIIGMMPASADALCITDLDCEIDEICDAGVCVAFEDFEELLPEELLLPLPEEPLLMFPGTLEGTGTYFELNDSEYLNISVASSEPISIRLESIPEMVTMHIQSNSSAASTSLTLGGFAPHTTYYKHEDDYHNLVPFTTDAAGIYTYVQDLSEEHFVFIQPRTSTKFIADNATGGDCASIGTWNDTTKICTLTQDLSETVQIDSSGITLDCDGHSTTGTGTGYGIYMYKKSYVTVKNCIVTKFSDGIRLPASNNNNLTDNTASGNTGIWLQSSCNYNTLTNNNASNSRVGIGLYLSNNNILTKNTANSNTRIGIYLRYSNNNNITNNTVSNNTWRGIYIVDSSNYNTVTDNIGSNNGVGITLRSSCNYNTLTNNTASSNLHSGINLHASSNNTFISNNASGNEWSGINLYWSSNNTFTYNIVSSNHGGILLDFSNHNDFANNTVSNNHHSGIWLRASSNYNTVTDNTVSNNTYYGIYLYFSSNNTLTNNIASNHRFGSINLYESSNNTLTNNTANGNFFSGIFFEKSSNNTITNNTASNNKYGIALYSSSNYNTLSENTITSNTMQGLRLISSPTTIVFHNNIYDNYAGGEQVYSNQPIELSCNGEGNYWGRIEPPPCFVAGVDSNSVDVVDSYPYCAENGWFDTTPPEVAAEDTTYPPNQTAAKYGDIITLNATITDDISGVKNATVDATEIGAGIVILENVHGTDYWINDSVIVQTNDSGTFYLNVTAYDNASNLNESVQLKVIVDNILPTITDLTCTPDPANVNAWVACNARITDNLNVKGVQANVTTPWSETFSQTVSRIDDTCNFTFTNTVSAGIYNVTWFATDVAGNSNTDTTSFLVKSITISIDVFDARGQIDRIVNPSEKITISGNAVYEYPFTGSVAGASVTALIDGTQFTSSTNETGHYTIPNIYAPPSIGNHTINVTITDSDGICNNTSALLQVRSNVITVKTDKVVYKPGEAMTILGNLTDEATGVSIEGASVAIVFPGFSNTTTTDIYGGYSNMTAAPATKGSYILSVNSTDIYGIEAENSTTVTVLTAQGTGIIITTERDIYHRDDYAQITLNVTNPDINPIPNVKVETKIDGILINTTSIDLPGDYGYVIFAIPSYYINSTYPIGTHNITAEATKAEGGQPLGWGFKQISVRALNISVFTNKTLYLPGETVKVFGYVTDALTGEPVVANVNVSIWKAFPVVFVMTTTTTSSFSGYYSVRYLTLEAFPQSHRADVNATDAEGATGENSTTFTASDIEVFGGASVYNPGDEAKIYLRIENLGVKTYKDLTLSILVEGLEIGSEKISELEPGEVLDFEFKYLIPEDVKPHRLWVSARILDTEGNLRGGTIFFFTVRTLTVSMDVSLDKPTSTLIITGDVIDTETQKPSDHTKVFISILDPLGNVVYSDSVLTKHDGSFSDSWRLVPRVSARGRYTVKATATDEERIIGVVSISALVEEPFIPPGRAKIKS